MPVKIICEKTGEPVTFKFVKGPSRLKCPSCGFGHFLTVEMINVPPGRGVETPRVGSEPVREEGSRTDAARGLLHYEWLLPDKGGLGMGTLARLARHSLEHARTECEWLADWKLVEKAGSPNWPRARGGGTSSRVARFYYLAGAARGARVDLTVVLDPRATDERSLRVDAVIRPENRVSRIKRLVLWLLLLAALGIWGYIGYTYATGSTFAPEYVPAVPEWVPEAAKPYAPYLPAAVAAIAPLVVIALVAAGVGIVTRIAGTHELGPIESHSIADAFIPAFEEMLVRSWSAKTEAT